MFWQRPGNITRNIMLPQCPQIRPQLGERHGPMRCQGQEQLTNERPVLEGVTGGVHSTLTPDMAAMAAFHCPGLTS